jgi:hypothetical protein
MKRNPAIREMAVLKIVELKPPDAIHVFVGASCSRARLRTEDRFLGVFRSAKSAIYLHHPDDDGFIL